MSEASTGAASRVAARLIAVKDAKARYAALRKVHRKISADFAQLNEVKAKRLVNRALRNVQAWERSGIASAYYVRAWRRILQDPAKRIPRMLRGHNANALVQNSPLGFLFKVAQYPNELRHFEVQEGQR